MHSRSIRHRLLLVLPLAAAAIGALWLVSATSGADVTRARLEASIVPTFANLYVQQGAILGFPDTTVASTNAHATCKKGGPTVADVGPGPNWICLITYHDHHHAMQTSKFEVKASADSCFTGGGIPTQIGSWTITDTKGHEVTNPVFEFDACFDPHGVSRT